MRVSFPAWVYILPIIIIVVITIGSSSHNMITNGSPFSVIDTITIQHHKSCEQSIARQQNKRTKNLLGGA